MRGQPGHNTRLHARLPHSFLCMDAWITSELNVDLITTPRGPLMCLAYFLTYHPYVCLCKLTPVDVRSTGAEMKRLYCTGMNWRLVQTSDRPHYNLTLQFNGTTLG